jgi:O-antigen ligase
MTYQRPLQWISMATAVLCTLWFYPSTLDPFNIPKLAVLLIGAAVLIGLLGGYAKAWWSRRESSLVGTVGLFVLGLTAAAIASDQNLYRTLWGAWARNDGWLAYVSLAVVLLAVAVAFRGGVARYGLYTLTFVGLCEVIYATLQTFGRDPVSWNSGYNPIIGTVGNPNFASALLGISAVAMCWVALEPSHDLSLRIGNALIALIAVWLTIRSDSIQGTLAFGAGLAMLLGGWLSLPDRRESLRRLLWPYVGVAGLSAFVGVMGLAGTGPLGSILHSQNLINRTYYWRAGWRMFLRDPLFGIGLDSFGDWYRIVRLPEQVAATGIQTSSNAAHSIVFQMLATGGLAFFGTYLLLQVLVVWRAVVAFRSGENRLLVSAVFGAWLAFLLQSLFSIDQLGLTVWGWVIGGLVIGVSYAPKARPAANKVKGRAVKQQDAAGAMLPLTAATVLGMGAILWVSSPLSYDSGIRNAVSYSVDNTQTSQVTAVTQAVLAAVDGAQDPYWRTQAIGKLYAISAVDEGIKLAEESAQMFPNDMQIWNLVAIAYEQTGRAKLAVPARQRTVELDPLNTDNMELLAQDKAAK